MTTTRREAQQIRINAAHAAIDAIEDIIDLADGEDEAINRLRGDVQHARLSLRRAQATLNSWVEPDLDAIISNMVATDIRSAYASLGGQR